MILSTNKLRSSGLLSHSNNPIEVVGCNISSDLRHCTVVWELPYTAAMLLPSEAAAMVEKFTDQLERGAGNWLQGELGKRLKKQYAARLTFKYDRLIVGDGGEDYFGEEDEREEGEEGEGGGREEIDWDEIEKEIEAHDLGRNNNH